MAKNNTKNGVIGIYISLEQIAIAEVSLKGSGKMQPDHLVKFSTDFPKKGGAQRPMSQNADFFKNEAVWVSKFKSAVGKISWKASEAVITLSENFSILRYFSMPAVPRKFWSKSIPLESKKYIPISFDNAALDYDAFISDGGKKISVLFGITQKETVDFLTKLMKDVKFNLHSLEISAVSMERFFTYIDHKEHLKHGYVHAADDSTHLLFSTGYRPVLHREFDNDSTAMSERRRLDLKGAIQYVDRYSDGEGFKGIILSGEYAQMMRDSVAKEAAPLPVTILDLESLCGTNDSSSAALFAMGAALFGKVSSALKMDVSGISNAIKANSDVQKIVYTIGVIAISILMLLTLKGEYQLSSVKKELNNYITQNGESDLKDLNSDEINNKITAIKDQAASLSYVFSRNDFVAPKLSVIVDEIPKQLWLDNIAYSNGLGLNATGGGIAGAGTRRVALNGGTYLTGEARAQITEGFLKKLKEYGSEYKSFIQPAGNMTLSVSATAKNKLMQNSAPSDGISKFTIECLEGAK